MYSVNILWERSSGACLSLLNSLQSGGCTYQASSIQLLTAGNKSRRVPASLSYLVPLVLWGEVSRRGWPPEGHRKALLTFLELLSSCPLHTCLSHLIHSTETWQGYHGGAWDSRQWANYMPYDIPLSLTYASVRHWSELILQTTKMNNCL